MSSESTGGVYLAREARALPHRVVLINPYELGRQSFALAEPAAWLRAAGFEVSCLDLTLQRLDAPALSGADLVAVHVGMHTATRIAVAALPRIRAAAPDAVLCVYGLYAPMNETLFRELGVAVVLGGEFEPGLLSLAQRVRSGDSAAQHEPVVQRDKIAFVLPDRSELPPLGRYAHLQLPGGGTRIAGFADASRGCKHLCRHCPVVPVYEGRFRIVPADIVLGDIDQQVEAGAQHISFGDPDFLNGPTHALRVVEGLHARHPQLTYDVTIKIEHLLQHAALLANLRATGCVFITSAVESVDDRVLAYLDKGHSGADFDRAVALLRETGIALAPTFVAFTPWTTLEGYLQLLRRLVDLRLVESVPPVQLSIRLLVPEGSYLLRLPELATQLGPFDRHSLGYPWVHEDPRVDALQQAIHVRLQCAETEGLSRRATFETIWRLAHQAAGMGTPALPRDLGTPIPRLSEPWYCCAEPTDGQLQGF